MKWKLSIEWTWATWIVGFGFDIDWRNKEFGVGLSLGPLHLSLEVGRK